MNTDYPVNEYYPIVETSIPAKVSPPKESSSSKITLKNENVPIWWTILSLIIVCILGICLIISIIFNFNAPIKYEFPCPTCCDLLPSSNNYLECYDKNQAQCRDLQEAGSGCNINNTSLINGPFVLISNVQSTSIPPVGETINPVSMLTVLNNTTVSIGETLSLSSSSYSNQSDFASVSTFSIDVYGREILFRLSNLIEVLAISQVSTTVEINNKLYILHPLKFVPQNDVPAGFVVPKVRFINGRIVLNIISLNNFSNYYLMAINSQDLNFQSLFTLPSADNAAVFATPTSMSMYSSGTILNPIYAQTLWTPYYTFQESR